MDPKTQPQSRRTITSSTATVTSAFPSQHATLSPVCHHIFTAQTTLSPLPPIYLAPYTTLRPSAIARLTRALRDLGTPCAHASFLTSDILNLRRELENGMSRERRQTVQLYVVEMEDGRKRAATELYLARYKGFAMGPDGRLRFGVEMEGFKEVEKPKSERGAKRVGCCVVM